MNLIDADICFPSPIEHAAALLDAHDNDIDEARGCARTNALNAAPDDDKAFEYWLHVLRALPRDTRLVEALQVPYSQMN
jgi:hypothetical protein